MNVYHRTGRDEVRSIVAGGFRDGEGMYMTDRVCRGVWVSDRDLEDHALEAPALLTLDVPEDVLTESEWVQEDLAIRSSSFQQACSMHWVRQRWLKPQRNWRL